MGYYEATDIIDGPQVVEVSRVQEDGDMFAISSTPENSADDFFFYIEEYAFNGVNTHYIDNPRKMNDDVKPFIIDGILAYPTSSQNMTTVDCVAVVEDMSPEEKSTFEQRHGIALDPAEHALVMYCVEATDWSPDATY